ncbi:MAG: valine--tRNA ligase [Candidatus Krumholzibacteriota bacterium]|nr:valine--tRNA ligase [Candidatus Krumholzibacteriota bacterium]
MLEKVYSPSDVERRWNDFWTERGVFTADAEADAPSYTIILPPPNVTGKLTIGHCLGTTVQDILIRWKKIRGCNVLWLPGTDHAGIATQNVVERSLAERGLSRGELGREAFLEECWRWKELYHGRIVQQLGRLGVALDWSREAFTLDEGVSRAVREVFVRLHEKGLVYRGDYIVNWCPSCGTAISDEEVEFVDTHGSLYYVAYPFADGGGELVVGTTRPETMLGDVAVAVSPLNERAAELAGRLLRLPLTDREIPVILDEAVDPEFGTGCLKVTPAHDTTDFEIGRRHDLDPVVVIGRDGRMNDRAGKYAGLDVFEARRRIVAALDEAGLLRRIDNYDHSVGHHDRCGAVVEPAISMQWFLRMASLAAPGIDAAVAGDVGFFPERWKNIYLSWMENIRDWCISRQLWWGHRIPVWYCGCGETIVSAIEPVACPACGSGALRQDEDVLDTWFSSWLWTFSPLGWPEQTKDLDVFHPTDVLVTGGDIIFFWVARMIMASLEFLGEIPFSTVYITGIVRDAKGRKMSKSLGNSPDPIDIIDEYGADALRFTLMMLSPPGQDLLFDEAKVETGRHFANKIWNAARFVLGREESAGPGSGPVGEAGAALLGDEKTGPVVFGWEDRWIASRLVDTWRAVDDRLERFRFDEAIRLLHDFFWHEFCDWYLEMAKPALREGGERAAGAVAAARFVLGGSMVLLYPFMPFITEEIWRMLAPGRPALSEGTIGLPAGELVDENLDLDVGLFKEIVTTIRNLRQGCNVPPASAVDVILNCEPGSGMAGRLARFEPQIRHLARVAEIETTEGAGKPAGSVAAGLAGLEIYLPLDGVVDLAEERARLKKELEKLGVECDKIAVRLDDGRFVQRAPAEVVARERERFEEMSDRRGRLERILEDIG